MPHPVVCTSLSGCLPREVGILTCATATPQDNSYAASLQQVGFAVKGGYNSRPPSSLVRGAVATRPYLVAQSETAHHLAQSTAYHCGASGFDHRMLCIRYSLRSEILFADQEAEHDTIHNGLRVARGCNG